jgi:hypothetical protein
MVFPHPVGCLGLSFRYLSNLRSDTYGVRVPVCLTNYPSSAAAGTSAATPKTLIAIGFGNMCCFMPNAILGKWVLPRSNHF